MYCRKCGVELRAGARFCQKCGAEAPKAESMSVPRPSSETSPSVTAYETGKEPSLIKTVPEPSGNSSNGQFHEWFSNAGDL